MELSDLFARSLGEKGGWVPVGNAVAYPMGRGQEGILPPALGEIMWKKSECCSFSKCAEGSFQQTVTDLSNEKSFSSPI